MALKALLLCLLLLAAWSEASKDVHKLQIGVKHKPIQCSEKAQAGQRVSVHYTGSLTDGTVFDSSLNRGDPITFMLGQGQVIRGWDQGISGMCVGEKRKLKNDLRALIGPSFISGFCDESLPKEHPYDDSSPLGIWCPGFTPYYSWWCDLDL